MFGDFTKGHWLSLYRKRFSADAPTVEMRIMTGDRTGCGALPDDMPNHRGFPLSFLWRLLVAWIAMGFRKPDMGLGQLPKAAFEEDCAR
jgi:hypothetical protein